jgi:hypothetical protein
MSDLMTGQHAPRRAARDSELRYGYTLTSLENLARRAVFESRWQFIAFHEKYEIAWSAIAEQLYASDQPPGASDLIHAGEKAIRIHVEDLGHTHGTYYYRETTDMPRYWKFWWSQAGPAPSPETGIVDVVTLQQIWPRLTVNSQRVLMALAVHGDYERAAESLNKPYRTFVTQVYEARRHFLRLWHEGEQPSRVWGHDVRKRSSPRQQGERSVTATTIRRRRQRAARQASAPPGSSTT